MKKLLIACSIALFSTASVFAQSPKPADLTTNNMLVSPDFGGSPCYAGWEIEVVEVACNVGPEYVWLNHNNRAGDPAVKQTMNNLIVGTEYEIVVGWRGGDHGPIHGVTGARNIFAIDIDGKEIYRLTTGPNYTDWMINDKLATDGSYSKLTFTATATSHTIRFRGEVGADGDVLIDWVQVKDPNFKASKPKNKPILGKWRLVSISGKSETGQMVFKKNGKAEFTLGTQTENFTYSISGKTITLNTSRGVETVEIIENKGNVLKLKNLNSGDIIIFNR